MRRAVMTAACIMAAASMVLCGCGQGDGVQGKGMTDNAADGGVREEGAADGASGSVTQDDAADDVVQGKGMADGASDDGTQDGTADGGAQNEDTAGAETVQLAGTSFSIVGDSISTFRDYNPWGYAVFFPEFGDVQSVEDTWWQKTADDLELTLYVNGSSSGSTVAGDSTSTEDPACACNELRTNELSGPEGACPDRIVIFMGTNDMLKAIPLGDNDGTRIVEEGEVETFSDAYTLMLDKLQANYPLAEFYCCTLLPVGDYGTDTPYVDFVNAEQLTSKDYGDVVARIAENRGIAVIDLYDCGITVENLGEMTTDGVHPTTAGMAHIAEAVEKALTGV